MPFVVYVIFMHTLQPQFILFSFLTCYPKLLCNCRALYEHIRVHSLEPLSLIRRILILTTTLILLLLNVFPLLSTLWASVTSEEECCYLFIHSITALHKIYNDADLNPECFTINSFCWKLNRI